METPTVTAERLRALAELYEQGQVSDLMERTLAKLLRQEAAVCQVQLRQLQADLREFEQKYQRSRRSFISSFQLDKPAMPWIMWNGRRFLQPLQPSPSSSAVAPLQRCRLSSTNPQPAGPAAVWRCWLLGACRRRGVLRQPGWWPPEPARHWYAGRLGGARCGETPALGSREKWLSFSYPPGLYALRWLAQQRPPAIAASEAHER